MKKLCVTVMAVLLLALSCLTGCNAAFDPDAPVTEKKKEQLLSALVDGGESFSLEISYDVSQQRKGNVNSFISTKKARIAGMVSDDDADGLKADLFGLAREENRGEDLETGLGSTQWVGNSYMLAFLRGKEFYRSEGEAEKVFAQVPSVEGYVYADCLEALKQREVKVQKSDVLEDLLEMSPKEVQVYAAPVRAILPNLLKYGDYTVSTTETGYEISCDLAALSKKLLKSLRAIIGKITPQMTLRELYRLQNVQELSEALFGGVAAKDLRPLLQEEFFEITGEHVELPATNGREFSEWFQSVLGDREFFKKYNTGKLFVSNKASSLSEVTLLEFLNLLVGTKAGYGNLLEEKDLREALEKTSEALTDILRDFAKYSVRSLFSEQTGYESDDSLEVLSPSLQTDLTVHYDGKGRVTGLTLHEKRSGTVKGYVSPVGDMTCKLSETGTLTLNTAARKALANLEDFR